jgi:hypothetical protein
MGIHFSTRRRKLSIAPGFAAIAMLLTFESIVLKRSGAVFQPMRMSTWSFNIWQLELKSLELCWINVTAEWGLKSGVGTRV